MALIFEFFDSIEFFLYRGGEVLWVIFFVTFVLWSLIAERWIFYQFSAPALFQDCVQKWKNQQAQVSRKHEMREFLLSRFSSQLKKNIRLIQVIVAVCPMLGLLGTVTGMIVVFDVMASEGTGNARLMASGISKATIPTMAGMVVSLSGFFFFQYFENREKALREKLLDRLLI